MRKFVTPLIIISALWISSCSKSDTPTKSCSAAPAVSAGDDQTLVDQTSANLAGTTDGDPGTWTIVQGTGGEILTGTPAVFKGVIQSSYTLRWTSKNDCGTSTDDVVITFNKGCGADQTLDNLVANIHWIEQSCFRIESSSYTIYTDPHSITKKDTADLIVITHAHTDHFSTADLDMISGPNTIIIAPGDVAYTGTFGKRVKLLPGETFQAFGCITIKAVPAYNVVNTANHPKANNWVGYLITVNGKTIYHAGDTELIPEMKGFTCDIAMVPLGQTYTFVKVEDAVQAVKDVQAKVAIPMHFGLYEGTANDATTFKNLLNGVVPVVIKVKGS